MLTLLGRALTADEAAALAGWTYDPPFDVYNGPGADGVAVYLQRDEGGYGYYPVVDDDEVVGFVCFGDEARVPGQTAEAGSCDLGAGIRPDRLSRRLGSTLLPQAVAYAAERFGARRVRVAIAAFNQRSQRLCATAGFQVVRTFDGPGGRPFVELVREIG